MSFIKTAVSRSIRNSVNINKQRISNKKYIAAKRNRSVSKNIYQYTKTKKIYVVINNKYIKFNAKL